MGRLLGQEGPELLDHRLALFDAEQRMVFGATTYRQFVRMLAASTEESDRQDPWVTRMRSMPATVVSTTLEGPLDWPDATVVSGARRTESRRSMSGIPTMRGVPSRTTAHAACTCLLYTSPSPRD